jgi:hypothetical protein
MPESRNRDIATSAGQAVANDIIATDGSLTGNVVTAYTNASDIPSSGSVGDMAYVTSTATGSITKQLDGTASTTGIATTLASVVKVVSADSATISGVANTISSIDKLKNVTSTIGGVTSISGSIDKVFQDASSTIQGVARQTNTSKKFFGGSSTITGLATISGEIEGFVNADAVTISGTSSVSANVVRIILADNTSVKGVSTTNASINKIKEVTSSVKGLGTTEAEATVKVVEDGTATIVGKSNVVASISKIRKATSNVQGVATVTGQTEKLRLASSVIVSVSTTSGSVLRLRNVIALISGVSNTTGEANKRLLADNVVIQGISTSIADSRTFIDAIASIQGLGSTDALVVSFNYNFFRENYDRIRTVYVDNIFGSTSAERKVLVASENRVVKIPALLSSSFFRRRYIRAR